MEKIKGGGELSGWRNGLPDLRGGDIVLRELRRSDAPALFALLTTDMVARFLFPPPATVKGFERFIDWTHRQRAAGADVCFAVTLKDYDTAIGVFQVRRLEPGFRTAEWGFALGTPFWGTGVFQASAELVLEFAFETLGVQRLEARAAVHNGRGTGALRKVGAVMECVLRRSFQRHGEYYDQTLFAILAGEWKAARTQPPLAGSPVVH